jgi:putative hydrolase
MTAREDLIFDARTLNLAVGVPAVDGHLHTSWTDGTPTVLEAHAAARRAGLSAMLYSEHSRKTSTDWFADFAAEVRALPSDECRAWVGTEVKVETQGGEIDTCPAISDLCDLIVVSVHRFPSASGEPVPFSDVSPEEGEARELQLSLAAMDNPLMDILGHPMGMTTTRFSTTPSDDTYQALMEKAARTRVVFEINASYHADPGKLLDMARDCGTRISLGSDAHVANDIGLIRLKLEKLVG